MNEEVAIDGDANATWERLCEEVTDLMERRQVPGVAVGILRGDEARAAGFGVTNVDHPLAVDADTLFQIGSITKTFTGTAVMRLVEQGKLDLDTPVQDYLPDFRVADATVSEQVTIRHLFTHVGGWDGDLFLDTGGGADALDRYVAAMADLEQLAPLGSHFSYNNAGFSLAGAIMEKVTEKPYEELMAELVLEPLALKRSYFVPGDVMTHRFASGHNSGPDGPAVARPWYLHRSAYPAGGIICSVTDLLAYARFHLGDGTGGDGERLLTEENLVCMRQDEVQVWGEEERWGLTWALGRVEDVDLVSHGGGTVGQISLLLLVPERNFALAVLTNADRGGQLIFDLRRWVLSNYLDLDEPEPEPRKASAEELAPFAGRYSRPFADIELGLLGGSLVGQFTYKMGFPDREKVPPAPPPVRLDLCEEDRLLVLDGPMARSRVDVVRNPDGTIGWLRMGRLFVRQDP